MSTIGHNSAAANVSDFDAEGPLLDDAREAVFHYVQWHVGDYMLGTAALSAEQEGIYVRFLMQLYAHGKPLPDDDKWMCKLLRLTIRVWRRVKADLVGLGKIIIRNTALTNSRFEKERQKRAEDYQKRAAAAHKRWAGSRKKPETSAKLQPNFEQVSEKKTEKVNEIKEAVLKEHMQTRIHITKNPESAASALARIEEAAGSCIANPAACPGLLMIGVIDGWLDQGCDLEKDILPTIRAIAARWQPHQKRITHWGYFTPAIAEARATRVAPLPKGTPRAAPVDREKAVQSSWLQKEMVAYERSQQK